MAKYRKLPVEIEAFQYDGDLLGRDGNYYVPEWMQQAYLNGIAYFKDRRDTMFIKTLEGDMQASIGDYIIQGVAGEIYACKPDIFAKTYELVELVEPCEENLYSFYWDCGRMGDVKGLFKAKPIEIKNLIGKKIYFGEILGKYSEVSGVIEADDIILESDDPIVVRVAIASGYNPLDYHTCNECGEVLSLEHVTESGDAICDCAILE